MTFGQIPPHPAALVESLGAMGYSLEAAVADLIDNCIAAGAASIDVRFDWNAGRAFATILDDGRGMSKDELIEGMRLGGYGPTRARRPDDLGRYGLGLKSASFSQCSRLTVATKRDSEVVCARWDLDELAKSGDWSLSSGPASGSEERVRAIETLGGSGTLVLWEELRTGSEGSVERFLEALERVEHHLAMVFHRFLDGDRRRIRLRLNGATVCAWDPFCTANSATTPKPIRRLRDTSGLVEVRGYVLPHRDRFGTADEHEAAGGPDGWIAQQGFYIYRAGRLIVAGGWLGLGGSREWLRDEASQLARIQVDIGNTADAAWRVDVRKATARAPALLRNDLLRIAVDVRRSARDVYAHRNARGATPQSSAGGLWRAADSCRYPLRIKRDHPAVQAVLDVAADPSIVDAMLVAIERSVPSIPRVDTETSAAGDFDEMVSAARTLMRNLEVLGVDRASAIERVARTDPFDQVPGIAELLRQDS